MKSIVLGGSTGTIGEKVLNLVSQHSDLFRVHCLIANSNKKRILEQIDQFSPKYVIFGEKLDFIGETVQIFDQIPVVFDDADIFVNAVSGLSGLRYSVEAVKKGIKIALANKESIVLGYDILKEIRRDFIKDIIPIDSEHNAVFQLLEKYNKKDIESIIITASGGRIKNRPYSVLTPKDILDHPNWKMGDTITVDSSTMVNKAYEVIEAHILFDMPFEKIKILFHPEAVIHAGLGLKDGNTVFLHSPTDMIFPIRHSLFYPHRYEGNTRSQLGKITFEEINLDLYPNFHIFLNAFKLGTRKMLSMIYSNENIVKLFINGKIKFEDIFKINEKIYESVEEKGNLKIEEIDDVCKRTDIEFKKVLELI